MPLRTVDRGRPRILLVSSVLIVAASAAACASQTARIGNPTTPHPSPTRSTATHAPSTVAVTRAAATSPARHTAKPKPTPEPTTGHVTIAASGAILPNHERTPGATNPAVSQATIHSTICVAGWTSTIRPSSTFTTALKRQQLASGYAYHGDTLIGDYEEDHLISLELGGSAASPLNLWPEPYVAAIGARTKDKVENRLHAMVCSGTLSLARAQQAIALNWWNAYRAYVGTATPTTPTAKPTTARPTPTSTPTPVAGPPAGATALCKDGTYSYAAHHQGACSHHGGVAVFYA